jgi:hypothetical protein
MWLAIIIALLFAVAAVFNLLRGDLANAAVGMIIAASILGVLLFFRRERRMSMEFVRWAAANREALERGPMLYQGKQVGMDTQLVRYWACMSFLVVTTRAPSRFLINAYDNTFFAGSIYSVITGAAGWWGLPWGPIFIVQTLLRNIRGGERFTVASLFTPGSAETGRAGESTHFDHIFPG